MLSFGLLSYSQSFRQGSFWKQSRNELIVGAGASFFLGELGGRDQKGSNFIQDLEFSKTRYVLNLGYRYFLLEPLSVKASFYYGMVSGDDATTKEPFRENRNLHFRAPLYEGSVLLEYHVLKERTAGRYNIRGAKSKSGFSLGISAFIGGGMTYFNPQARYQREGEWVNLSNLGTEGQGLPDGPSKYKKTTFVIPMGIAFRYSISSQIKIGLELATRKTFTDYIDDVSGNYYDNSAIETANGANGTEAAWFADPSLSRNDPSSSKVEIYTDGAWSSDPTLPGRERGDATDNDSYGFVVLTANYKIGKKGFRKVRTRRSVPSF